MVENLGSNSATNLQYLQNIANEFGIRDISTAYMPDEIYNKFYKLNPTLRPTRRAQRKAQPRKLIRAPPPEISTNRDNPIVLSDSSDDEYDQNDVFTTAPSSPISGESELDLATKKHIFYKHLFLALQDEKSKVPSVSTMNRAAKMATVSLEKQKDPRDHKKISSRSERKLEMDTRRIRHHDSRIKTTTSKSTKFISQEAQVRHAQDFRLTRKESDENDELSDSNVGNSLKHNPFTREDRKRRGSIEIRKRRHRSPAPPPPDVRRTDDNAISPPPPSNVQQPSFPVGVRRRVQPTLVSPFPQSYSNPNRYPIHENEPIPINYPTPANYLNPVNHPTPISHQNPVSQPIPISYPNPVSSPAPASNDNEKKSILNYKSVQETVGIHVENDNAGPSQANAVAQKPLCPTELSGLNCVDVVCRYSHFRDYQK
ncbi:hypothetical protein K501DRAFT_281396 [Backusella circina FSU 941]|nr:hypothetical protein K501DRAFT_281396 [Backusella circina FSU 941]